MAIESPQGSVANLELRLAALERATIALTAEPSLDGLLQLIVDLVRPVAAARYAALGIVGAEGSMERFVTSGISEETRRAIGPLPQGHGLLGVIVRENRTIRVHDVSADVRSAGFPPAHPRMYSFLGTPVMVEGRSIGNLYLTEKQGAEDFSDDDVRILETFARYAGIAMENARLHAELERVAVIAERERIGQDLHDGVIQSLYAVGLSLEDLGDVMREQPEEAEVRVEHAIDAINGTIRDLRSFIFGLRPEYLEAGDVRAALAALADEFRRSSLMEVQLELSGRGDVPPVVALQIMQVAREALSNVARHSGASRVVVRLEAEDRKLHLTISDNGRGFDIGQGAAPGHRGLGNMMDRARSLGGELTTTSRAGETRIAMDVPFSAGRAEELRR